MKKIYYCIVCYDPFEMEGHAPLCCSPECEARYELMQPKWKEVRVVRSS